MTKYHTKKLALAVAALGALALGTDVAQAAAGSQQFNVSINLTSTCTLGAVTPVAFSYTSLQGGSQAGTGGNFSVTCTNTLPYTFGLQAGTAAATPPGTATINVTDSAVNLNYTLGTNATGANGNGAAQNFNVTGTMGANQSGTCGTGSCTNGAATNAIQTLILNY